MKPAESRIRIPWENLIPNAALFGREMVDGDAYVIVVLRIYYFGYFIFFAAVLVDMLLRQLRNTKRTIKRSISIAHGVHLHRSKTTHR